MEKVTIYDELDRPYRCLVEGSRVLTVLQAPEPQDSPYTRQETILECGWAAYAREEDHA